MKKIPFGLITSLSIGMFGVLAIAGNLTDIPTEAGISKIKEVVNANNALFNSGTVTQNNVTVSSNLTVSGDADLPEDSTVDSVTPIVSTNASGLLMVQKGAITSTGGTETQTFANVFSEAPTVVWRYTTAGIAATGSTTVASNSLIIVAETNLEWIAIGTRP